MLPGEPVPPEVEDSAPLSDRPEARMLSLLGVVLIVVSAIVSLVLLYAAWVGLTAAWHIARR